MGDGGVDGVGSGEKVNHAHALFDRFVQASTCKGTLKAFQELCDFLELRPSDCRIFYHKLKSRLNYWKAKALWAKLDKRACHKEYKKGRACANSKCLIIGAGPCGLRTAIELAFLGAKVVLLEKRDAFSRNNVLHLWPFTIQDLRGLGAKKFYGKFCAGAIDHISIRQLQLVLLKVALLLGIEIHVNVEFKGLIEPPEEQENNRVGWRAEVLPDTHPVNEFEFDVIIGADGRRNTLPGFRRKEFRGKLAIAITANFINRHTSAEAKVEEISGVAFIFNQKFFQDLREATGIDLENIGVILQDYVDTELLLSRGNVDQAALLSYAREAADFSTNHQLPTLDFAINHYGQPDVAMFDFTCMYASENAALVRQRNGHKLLVTLVGDSLLEPFWPMGTGIARGFLAAMDSAWMVRSWAQGSSPLEVLAERESIYRLLPQTTPENVSKNFSQYSLDPTTRYPNISLNFLRPAQVQHLLDTGECKDSRVHFENMINASTPKLKRNENDQHQKLLQESIARSSKLLSWCQRQTEGYQHVCVTNLTTSWKSGLALCAIIHHYRPDLIEFDSLEERDIEGNNQLAFDVAEREFGISPIMTGQEMSSVMEPDQLSMVMYLSQFYEMFKDMVPPGEKQGLSPEQKAALIASNKSPISFLSMLGQTVSRKRVPKDKKETDSDGVGKRRKTSQPRECVEGEDPQSCHDNRPPLGLVVMEPKVGGKHKVKSMANQLLAKFEENAPAPLTGLKRQTSLRKEFPQNLGGSDVCFFCQKRVYVMERLSAEGKFFHRSCFKCDYCGTTLRLSSYAFDVCDGKFYCKPHYCYRLSGQAQRKRPAPTVAPPTAQEAQAPPPVPVTLDMSGQANLASLTERRPSVEVIGLQEPSLAKRLRSTPERIELENYRSSISLQRPEDLEEEPEEVPEETLAEHNLSSLPHKSASAEPGSSSSESEEEEEDEEEEQAPSDLGGVAWKDAVEMHAKLKRGANCSGKEEEEEEESEEESEDEEESSDGRTHAERQEAVRAWVESLSGELCEEEEEDGDPGGLNLEIGTELDEENIPSDVEAELKPSAASERQTQRPVKSSVSPQQSLGEDVLSPAKDVHQVEASVASPPPYLLRSGLRFFPEPAPPAPPSTPLLPPATPSSPKQGCSSSSGPGLINDGYTPDSTLLTPPSSPPPPPPPNEEPASLCCKKHSISQEAVPAATPTPVLEPKVAPRPTGGLCRRDAVRMRHQDKRPSFMDSVDDIPYADDEEDNWEEVLAVGGRKGVTEVTAQVRLVAEERLREREKSIKSQALKDAMARQLSRMKEANTSSMPGAAAAAMDSGKANALLVPGSDPETHKQGELQLPDEVFTTEGDGHSAEGSGGRRAEGSGGRSAEGSGGRSAEGSGGRSAEGSCTSSGSSAGHRNKKSSSLFSPRKSKKEKKAENELGDDPPKHKSLWKTVFSGHRKDKKKEESQSSSLTGSGAVDTVERRTSPRSRSSDLQLQRRPSLSEDSDLSYDDLLQHSAQKSKGDSVYVPHALAFKRAYAVKKAYTEEELNAKLTRRVQKAARRQAKQEELKRLHRAQIIQRQLEQVEEKQRQLEERGVAVEKALRGEAGMGRKDDPSLMQEWFRLVQEKNALVRYESELMIFAQELELEDRQSRLQQDLRERMAVDDHLKSEAELAEEKQILGEMLEVVEQRDSLVALLEEQRLREREEDRDLESVMLSKGYSFNWA
ncbi:hypothetical protein AGOR_G00230520 [Albula goreensis]|uniref:F-actin monooxygenase n=2 Tax=Albula TaxID=54908 RepID=A0A8T3CHS4_9TELE|nr:hypothetical protein AGOR_G00230520 [Albula goreensis]